MFQYSTRTILNDITGVKKFTDALSIPYAGTFKKKFVNKITKCPFLKAAPAKMEITVGAPAVNDVCRLTVALVQEGLVTSYFQNAMLRKNKPFFYEVTADSADAAELAKKFAKLIKKEGHMGLSLFEATATGAKITLTATDVYSRFVEDLCAIDIIEPTGDNVTGYRDYKPLVGSTFVVTERGTEGVGTSHQLLKNESLPTIENVDPFGADTAGKPLPGGEYYTYTIEYMTPRRHVGHQVMGAVDWSLTGHVIYVLKSLVTEFDGALEATIGGAEEFKTLYGSQVADEVLNVELATPSAEVDLAGAETQVSTLPDLILDDEEDVSVEG